MIIFNMVPTWNQIAEKGLGTQVYTVNLTAQLQALSEFWDLFWCQYGLFEALSFNVGP